MFKVGETIVCDHNGVCEVVDIREIPELSPGRLYYVLEPVYSRGSRIFAPVDTQKLVIRSLMTAEEVQRLMDDIPNIESMWITNEKKREDAYKAAARQYDCREWIRIIKTIHLRKLSRLEEGKKITYIDEKYLKLAEENLYRELCIPLGIGPDEVDAYIHDHIVSSMEADTAG